MSANLGGGVGTEAAPQKIEGMRRSPTEGKGKARLWLILIAALIGGGYWAYQKGWFKQSSASSDPADTKQRGRGRGAGQNAMVSVASARIGDIPIYLNGLGSV
ncbi:MAG: hypothetical protein J2P21_30845, partial [Chloracidobacterium sp.]|nr:hypothetical protein [Chloracidobacterium sp.]